MTSAGDPLIEVPEDVLLDVFITHGLGRMQSTNLLREVKEAATAAENERLEHPFRDSRRGS